ncbi:tRNA(Ile)-lysidine synthase [Gracilariopsis chorda]|uniref:tRNA(Ile)-lysidine synthetase n=1 Tax=Gracilariopsis chorda TaxID=448386 RepID=A0A2V3IZL0_9FLOR|nr:tRNA(Ile)-lysidine synthase [Gracilariopsis chorda]|eukprot:PXF47578.1 tRNA(Ile)-lysidine synthase [Gracilariopsis chorda]
MLFSAITQRLRRTLECRNLLPYDRRVLIAVSGGQDSLSLAEAFRYLHAKRPWNTLELAHCDHKWPADHGNPEHVACYARHANLPLHIIPAKRPVPLSENAAREWRYESLGSLAEEQGFTDVLTAHTATDLAETVIFNLSNGSGADGLSSLSWSRALSPSVSLVRPFLNVTRAETHTICVERHIPVWRDVYNDDPRYARNRIRSCVFPALRKTLHPQVEQNLSQSAHLLRDDAACLRAMAEFVLGRAVYVTKDGTSESQMRINRQLVLAEHRAVQRRVIRMALERYLGLGHRGATFSQVEAVCHLLEAPVGKSSPSLTRQAQATVISDKLISIDIPCVSALASDSFWSGKGFPMEAG